MIEIIYVFILALLFALVEIEIEGKSGWAGQLPTWKRTNGLYTKLTRKPLTGYHAFITPLIILLFHFHFVVSTTWSIAAETLTLSYIILFFLIEDYLWFVLNPFYKGLRKEEVWWHKNNVWFGKVFGDYIIAFVIAFVLETIGFMLIGIPFFALTYQYAGLFILIIVTKLASPLYHRWYRAMRN